MLRVTQFIARKFLKRKFPFSALPSCLLVLNEQNNLSAEKNLEINALMHS
jgi:hypothetical protein